MVATGSLRWAILSARLSRRNPDRYQFRFLILWEQNAKGVR